MLRKLLFILLLTPSLIFFLACGDDDSALAGDDYAPYQNLIFRNTTAVSTVWVSTNGTKTPTFYWPATGKKYVVVTIFREQLDVKNNRIMNTNAAAWTWNTGLGKGIEGNITFADGVDMVNGKIQSTTSPLTNGTYYWAVWAFDDNYELTHSSIQFEYQCTN